MSVMKKVKKLTVLILSLVVVLGLISPASAASASFSALRVDGYACSGSLNLAASTVSGSFFATVESGLIIPNPFSEVLGGAYDKNGTLLTSFHGDGDLSCSGSSSFQGVAVRATGFYYLNGKMVKNLTTT